MQQDTQNIKEAQYNLCIECPHIGRKCDGPNFLAMPLDELLEWCRKRKDHIHKFDPRWTNAYIAEKSGISLASVNRFFSGNITDLRFSTAAPIIKAIVVDVVGEDDWGEFPCPMVGMAETNPDLKNELDKLKDAHDKEMELMREKFDALREKHTFYEEQIAVKDRHIDELNERMRERTEFLYRKDKQIKDSADRIRKLYIATYSLFALLVAGILWTILTIF